MPEKREYKRFDADGKVGLKTEDGMNRILSAYLDDVGLGGLRMHSQEEMESDKNVRLAVTTPLLDRPLLGRGRIRHINSVKLYGTDFFSIGVQFTQINKNKIKHLINESQQWRKRPFFYRQHRRELFFLLKLLPVIILIEWPILKVANDYSYYRIKEQQYREKRRNAEIYYLYHSYYDKQINSSAIYEALR